MDHSPKKTSVSGRSSYGTFRWGYATTVGELSRTLAQLVKPRLKPFLCPACRVVRKIRQHRTARCEGVYYECPDCGSQWTATQIRDAEAGVDPTPRIVGGTYDGKTVAEVYADRDEYRRLTGE